MNVQIELKDINSIIPKQANLYDAGFDLVAHSWLSLYRQYNIEVDSTYLSNFKDSAVIHPRERLLVGTGIYMAIPHCYHLDIRSISELALKEGLVVCNSPGTIDSDYRGEIGVILLNTSNHTVNIMIGQKIAQAVLLHHHIIETILVAKLPPSKRGTDGFGSSDK